MLLDSGEIGEVYPLNRLSSSLGGDRDIRAIVGCHDFDLLEGSDLLADLFSESDLRIVERISDLRKIFLLRGYQSICSRESESTIVPYDTTSGIVVRESCDDMVRSIESRLIIIDREDSIIMIIRIGKNILHSIREFVALFLQGSFDDSYPTEWLDRSSEWCISLESDDLLEVSIDISWSMTRDRRYGLVID